MLFASLQCDNAIRGTLRTLPNMVTPTLGGSIYLRFMAAVTSTTLAKAGDMVVLAMAIWTVSCNLNSFTGGGLFLCLATCVLITTLCVGIAHRKSRSLMSMNGVVEDIDRVDESNFQHGLVWTLIIFAMVLTLVAHRPDQDDCQWISWAVAALDDPHAGILRYNTMNAPPWTPLTPDAYRFHSFEMLGALVSWLTSVPPIAVFHLLFAPIAALLAIAAYTRLFRLLSPRHWGYGVLAVFVFLCANGDTHWSWGNFSFVRLHQAKGILVTVILPMIVVYGLRLARQPTCRSWVLLFSVQIVALGASFSALFVAPPVAVLSLVAGLPDLPRQEQIRRLALGLSTSVYLIAAGILLKFTSPSLGHFLPTGAARDIFDPKALSTIVPVWKQATEVFGEGRSLVFGLLVTVIAWALAENRISRRLCVVFPAGVLLFFFNPVATPFLTMNVTGLGIYWRVLWILPIPAMVGIVLLAPLSTPWGLWRGWQRHLAFVSLLAAVFFVLHQQHIFSKENRAVRLSMPSLKVTPTYHVAKSIVSLTKGPRQSRPVVLGPNEVTLWLPTFRRHPYPLCARLNYGYTLGADSAQRRRLKYYVAGLKRPENAPTELRNGLQHYLVQCVCLPESNPWIEEFRVVLSTEGFTLNDVQQGYGLWIRDSFESRQRPEAGRSK